MSTPKQSPSKTKLAMPSRSHPNKYRGKTRPPMVYAYLTSINGTSHHLRCAETVADYFGLTKIFVLEITGSDGVTKIVVPRQSKKVKLPSRTKTGRLKYFTISVPHRLTNNHLADILDSIIKKNKPSYFLSEGGNRVWINLGT